MTIALVLIIMGTVGAAYFATGLVLLYYFGSLDAFRYEDPILMVIMWPVVFTIHAVEHCSERANERLSKIKNARKKQ